MMRLQRNTVLLIVVLLLTPIVHGYISVEPTTITFGEMNEQQTVSLELTRTVTYQQAYLNENGSWQEITLENTNKRGNWHLGRTTADIGIREAQTRSQQEARIATYSCNWNGSWQCPTDWQITTVQTTHPQEEEPPEEEPPQNDTDTATEQDQEVLQAFYESTNGAGWTENTGWSAASIDINQPLYGVETQQINGETRVTRIDLQENNLQGQIPTSIGQLSELRYLNIKQNALTGEIPSQIGDLVQVQTLLLSGVPEDPPTNVNHNRHQGKSDESGNTFSGEIPPEIGQLSNLEILELSGSDITGTVPPEIGQLSNLRFLALSWNPQLTGPLPDEIGNLQNLVWMYFRASGLTGEIPTTISNMQSLRTVHFGNGNSLTGELPDLSGLVELRNFNVDNNDLSGPWPTYWNNGDFQFISLRGTWNNFSGELHGFENLESLISFDVTGNDHITGTIQGADGLSAVKIFGVGWNQLTGPLPDMSTWTRLRTLYVNDNAFSGPLPAGIGNIDAPGANLNLYMQNNQLSGSIPSNWQNINVENFNYLRLQDNNLRGYVPPQLANMGIGSYTLANNQFVFSDLIDSLQENPLSLSYNSQQLFGQSNTYTQEEGQSLTIDDFSTVVTHPNNAYQWYKQDQSVNGQTSRELQLNSLELTHAGEYTLQVTNSEAPELTLTSRPITVEVTPAPEEPEPDGDLSDEILPNSRLVSTENGNIHLAEVARGLDNPWGIAFLPDGRMIVTEKVGNIRIVSLDGTKSQPLNNELNYYESGQAGLLDVQLHPDFEQNRWVYFTYSGDQGGVYMTQLARAQLINDDLENYEVLFQGTPAETGSGHFGSRITFDDQNHVYFSIGDRQIKNRAQRLDQHHGSIIRLNDDGSVPSDNPFVNTDGALPEIYAYGVRNPQGLTTNPYTGDVWEQEHGPQGGDEINIIYSGENYGWPLYTEGVNYGGSPLGADEPPEGTILPVHYWVPSIAPSGMTFYTGDKLSAWTGDLFNGALANSDRGRRLSRLEVTSNSVTGEEQFLIGEVGRIRDIKEGPDEYLYLATDSDNGRIYRLGPFEQ